MQFSLTCHNEIPWIIKQSRLAAFHCLWSAWNCTRVNHTTLYIYIYVGVHIDIRVYRVVSHIKPDIMGTLFYRPVATTKKRTIRKLKKTRFSDLLAIMPSILLFAPPHSPLLCLPSTLINAKKLFGILLYARDGYKLSQLIN